MRKEGPYREALLVHVVAVHARGRVLLGVLGVGVGRGGWSAEGEAEQREEEEREVRQAHCDASVGVEVEQSTAAWNERVEWGGRKGRRREREGLFL